MIYTSSYKNVDLQKYNTISISGDKGKDANYFGNYFLDLAPKRDFWVTWRQNIGKISEEENNKYYMDHYYDEVLSHLDPKEVYDSLDNSVLLCYEDNMEFCHRHIVSAWFEITLGVVVDEIKDGKVVDKPEYIKKYLKQIMGVKEKRK